MKFITPKMHGYLDYATVVLFLLAPTLFGFDGLPALLSWALAGIHLIVTLVTDFPLGWYPLLPFWLHGWIERIVGPALVLIAFLPGFADAASAFVFYLAVGVVIIAVAGFTDYGRAPAGAPGDTR